jgi:adenosylcobinamide-GDP ribazoletransferase
VPVPAVEATPRALARSAAFFPVVGAVLALAVGAIGVVVEPWLPRGPAVVLQLVLLVVLTGGLHLDGLMDTADGVFGGRTRERRLEIMRDSRVGAFGVLAGGLALLAQFACLVELAAVPRLIGLVVALTVGRWVMVLALGAFPSARVEGLGAAYGEAAGIWPGVVATGFVVAIALGVSNWSLALEGLGLALVVALGGGRWLAGRLGGLTGDTYGALCVVAETCVLYVAVVALR